MGALWEPMDVIFEKIDPPEAMPTRRQELGKVRKSLKSIENPKKDVNFQKINPPEAIPTRR